MSIITYKTGDLMAADEPAIAHGCNTHGVMGAGVARLVRDQHPEVFYTYAQACDTGRFRIGTAQAVSLGYDESGVASRWVYNLGTQEHPGPDATTWAVFLSFANMAEDARVRKIDAVAIPRIGCGIGGLTWPDVEANINAAILQSTHPDLSIVVYDLPEAS
jgi:O-acetyl-ADP-ribose deacetylase (regulator of RNase III)